MKELGYTLVESVRQESHAGLNSMNEGHTYKEWSKPASGGRIVAIEVIRNHRFDEEVIGISMCFVPNLPAE